MQDVEIALTSKHFLYLPLLYAEKKEWFGYLEPYKKDFRLKTRSIGKETQVSDVEVMRRVKEMPEPNVKFGICDPAYLLTEQENITKDIIVIAGIVTNAGLWAVAHKNAEVDDWSIEALGDKFNEFFAYGEENTAHKVAEVIMKSSADYEEKTFAPIPAEFSSESEFFRTQLIQNPNSTNWVVITPNILSVYETHNRSPHMNDLFPIGATQQFLSVLSSALITTTRFRDANQDFCNSICRALQRAMILTVCEDRDVVDFAQEEFGVERHMAQDALAAAVEARAFPPLVSVSRGEWNAACRAHQALRALDGHLPQKSPTKCYYDHVDNCVLQVHTTVSEELTRWVGDIREGLSQDQNLCEKIVTFSQESWPKILEWCKIQFEKTINRWLAAFVASILAWLGLK